MCTRSGIQTPSKLVGKPYRSLPHLCVIPYLLVYKLISVLVNSVERNNINKAAQWLVYYES